LSWLRRVTRSLRNRPKLIRRDESTVPKPGQRVSSSSSYFPFLDLKEPKLSLVNRPKSVVKEVLATTSLAFSPRAEAECVSQSLGTAEAALGLRISRSSSRFAVGAEASREPAWGSESLPPTLISAAPRCRRVVVRALMQASVRGPGARHATRKLMAPPLGSFVLSAFFSLGNRNVPVYLSGTVRSQGFSPSQRFLPARALRLCFASHPPLGFSVFRAFSTQPAVASFDARCSFVVSSSSGSVGFPRPPLLPQLFIAREDSPSNVFRAANPLCAPTHVATSSPLRLAEAIRSGASGHAACRGLMHKNSSRGSSPDQRPSGTMPSWHGMPTLEPCSD